MTISIGADGEYQFHKCNHCSDSRRGSFRIRRKAPAACGAPGQQVIFNDIPPMGWGCFGQLHACPREDCIIHVRMKSKGQAC